MLDRSLKSIEKMVCYIIFFQNKISIKILGLVAEDFKKGKIIPG